MERVIISYKERVSFILYTGKDQYIQMLINSGDFETANEKAALSEYSPLFKERTIHAEESPIIKDYNTMLIEAKNDINILNYEIMLNTVKLKSLADTIIFRFNEIEQKLLEEKSLRDDMQMLCNAYQEFENLIVVDDYITYRTCDYQKGIFKARAESSKKINFSIKEITGNGHAGNNYVLDGDSFLKTSTPNNIEKALTDDDIQTYYDYQRITVGDSETLYGQYMYKDLIPARCNIVLEADSVVNECQINGNVFILNDLYFSNDGVSFSSSLSVPIKLDNTQSIQSTGYCAFPSGKYVKLACESFGVTDEKIGIETVEPSGTSLQIIESAKRHLIRLNEIYLMRSVYKDNTYFSTDNLLNYPVQAVAVYADIYVPNHFKKDDYVQFTLTINSKSFKVVPINSELNGTKVIKTSTLDFNSSYSEYINEPITDVRLTVTFKCPNNYESAVIKHVRLMVGEKYES